jgi:hypothetical protein
MLLTRTILASLLFITHLHDVLNKKENFFSEINDVNK